jgi:hypothetical protein
MKYPVTTNFKIIIGWEWSWIQERVPRNSWCYEGQWAGGGYCGDGINFINLKYIADAMRTGGVEVPFRTEEDKLAQSATLSHEIAHQAQGDNLAKYGRGTSFYPAWLREGGPEIIKVLAFAKTNKITYLEGRELYLKRQYDRCQFVKLNELLMADNHPDNCQGVLGLIASEALIATTKDMGSLFTFVSSKIEGYGPKFNQERKGISDETYKSVMMEIYKIDIDTWHPLVEKEFVRWAPARQR